MRGYSKAKVATHYLQVDHREFSTILAALRYWRREGLLSAGHEIDIATDGGDIKRPLSNAEIDKLVMDLNTGGRGIIPMPAALTRNLTSPQDADLIEKASRYQTFFDDREAFIKKHKSHTLQLTDKGIYCRRCGKVIIHDADSQEVLSGS